MPKKVFIDSDVIIDLIAEREGFFSDAAKLFSLIMERKIQGFTSSLIVANCIYIINKSKNNSKTATIIKKIQLLFKTLPTTDKNLLEALTIKTHDYEDAIQCSIAKQNKIDTIITRNTKHYKNCDIKAISPKIFLKSLNL